MITGTGGMVAIIPAGAGGYYPPVYYDSYTTGTLIMDLIDPDALGANGNPVTQWTGAINGIMTGYL